MCTRVQAYGCPCGGQRPTACVTLGTVSFVPGDVEVGGCFCYRSSPLPQHRGEKCASRCLAFSVAQGLTSLFMRAHARATHSSLTELSTQNPGQVLKAPLTLFVTLTPVLSIGLSENTILLLEFTPSIAWRSGLRAWFVVCGCDLLKGERWGSCTILGCEELLGKATGGSPVSLVRVPSVCLFPITP